MNKLNIKPGDCYKSKSQKGNTYWKVLEIQKGGILCKSPQINKSNLIDLNYLNKNYLKLSKKDI